ncbi:hypothetical protein [Phenylobacterium sp.]|uniref:hypothetical protein n=1 Tax=Phenylobacterium sp. TaxID=1871053 RepID=UPI0035B3A397
MRRGQMIVLVMSLGAHIVVLGALMVQRHALSLVPATPVMEVLIAPPFQRRPVAEPPQRPEPPPRPHAARASQRAPIQRNDPDLAAPAAAPGPPRPPAPLALRRALRGLIGCGMADLTEDERERCEARLAVRDGRGAPKLNLDVHGDFDRDPDPYLARRPKNGCKARAGGDVDPAGEQGAAIGLSCAWAF